MNRWPKESILIVCGFILDCVIGVEAFVRRSVQVLLICSVLFGGCLNNYM